MGFIRDKAMLAWHDHIFAGISEREKAARDVGDEQAVMKCWGELSKKYKEDAKRRRDLFPRGKKWDFSQVRLSPSLNSGNGLLIRPTVKDDLNAFGMIRNHYSNYSDDMGESMKKAFWDSNQEELANEKSFIAAIIEESTQEFIGYISIKDSAVEIWEIAIELAPEWCGKGYGPIAIQLFLDAVHHITGKNEFRAFVEVDNFQSQHCMKKANAVLVGLFDMEFGDPQIAEKFENENTDLITSEIEELAKELNVEPKKLLSKVLDYRFYY